MEHEVFVPVPAERLSQALADPARVARAIPGLQQDAGTEPVAGRLKVRAGGHTITYRGTLRIEGRDDGSYAVEGEATEARGTGTAKLSLSLRLTRAEDGTTVTFTGTATADGRIADLPAETVASAATRLLGRFAEKLGEVAEEGPREMTEPPSQEPAPEERPASAGDTEVPASPPEPLAEEVEPGLVPDAFDEEVEGGLAPDTFDEEPPAEAAHARRTMIGRSAEEVDHAPPRGRYAPVPPPEAAAATATLRWAAPAAALLVASAIVAGRLLRRRR
ncbi:SRPBCC family protein [Streptomyces sp. NPDC003758]|uniref:SRPBCC domain-containing protein n=1 Tax=Streptomyces cynarae TaxID=2981134 RepID=A0ABY6EAH2_9ACTN|nr:SRPBCC family protein [Streptomyces cynarae]UXY21043.1 SRPBCC domain-containing protein [Streptomyces cynarae]